MTAYNGSRKGMSCPTHSPTAVPNSEIVGLGRALRQATFGREIRSTREACERQRGREGDGAPTGEAHLVFSICYFLFDICDWSFVICHNLRFVIPIATIKSQIENIK